MLGLRPLHPSPVSSASHRALWLQTQLTFTPGVHPSQASPPPPEAKLPTSSQASSASAQHRARSCSPGGRLVFPLASLLPAAHLPGRALRDPHPQYARPPAWPPSHTLATPLAVLRASHPSLPPTNSFSRGEHRGPLAPSITSASPLPVPGPQSVFHHSSCTHPKQPPPGQADEVGLRSTGRCGRLEAGRGGGLSLRMGEWAVAVVCATASVGSQRGAWLFLPLPNSTRPPSKDTRS